MSTRHRRPTRTAASSTRGLTMSTRATSSRCSAGTTTSGATPTGSSTSPLFAGAKLAGSDARGDRHSRCSKTCGDVERQAGAGPHRLQRAARRRADHRRLPHPRRAADDRVAARARRHGGRAPATSAGRRASRTRSTRWHRCARAWPSWRPGVELLENLRFDPGEEGNDPAFVAELVEGIDAYVDDAFGAAHRAHASIVGPPQTLPSAMGRLLAEGGRRPARPARTARSGPFVAVLGGAKISDKLGVVEALLDDRRRAGHRRGDVLHVPRRAGQPDRRLAVRARPGRHVPAPARRRGKTIHLPEDIVGLDADGSFADVRHAPARRRQGLRHRPGHRRGVQRRDHGRPHRVLERADGHVRGRPLRRRHPHRRPGDGRHEGVHRRRRRRLRRGAGRVRARRRGRPRVHRRGSVARAARARRPARPRRAAGGPECHDDASATARAPPAAHLRQLEDAPQPLRGDPDRAEAGLPRRQGRPRRTSTSASTRRSPTSAACRR